MDDLDYQNQHAVTVTADDSQHQLKWQSNIII